MKKDRAAKKRGGAKKGGAKKRVREPKTSPGDEAAGASDEGGPTEGGAESLSERLAGLTNGLLYMSESDYPLEPFAYEAGGAADAREAVLGKGAGGEAEVRELDFDHFFSNSTKEQEWHDEEGRATAKRFQALVSFMKESLSDIKVFRVGGVDADVYVVGRTKAGGFAGVKTKVVET
jgi:hypothetical protein